MKKGGDMGLKISTALQKRGKRGKFLTSFGDYLIVCFSSIMVSKVVKSFWLSFSMFLK